MSSKIIESIVSGFRKAATDLEELELQFALGKAEAKDRFELLKKKFNSFIQEADDKLDDASEWMKELRTKLDELRLQLALGKAETKDAFDAQRKKINIKIQEVENYINSHPGLLKIYDFLIIEFERIKVELEILAANFKISSLKTEDSLKKRREEMDKIVSQLKDSLEKHGVGEEKENWSGHFKKEISEAYGHLKSAFKLN